MGMMRNFLLAGACLGLAACKPEPKPAPAPEPPPANSPEAKAVADPNEAKTYVGMTLPEAQTRADKAQIMWRVVEEDGVKKPVTMDHRPERLNFAVEKGKVIRVTKG